MTLGYLAAATDQIVLGVGVLVLLQRHPVLLAKQLTTPDLLSGGRLEVGVGIGHVEAELAASGVALDERSHRTDEHLAALRTLWAQQPDFTGQTVNFHTVRQFPAPARPGWPAVVVGRHAPAPYDAPPPAATAGSAGRSPPPQPGSTSLTCPPYAPSPSESANRSTSPSCPTNSQPAPWSTRTTRQESTRLVLRLSHTAGHETDTLIDYVGTILIPAKPDCSFLDPPQSRRSNSMRRIVPPWVRYAMIRNR
jgi:hypothetical protein